jgi:hypothetical protein
VVDSCEHGDEISSSIRVNKMNSLVTISFTELGSSLGRAS